MNQYSIYKTKHKIYFFFVCGVPFRGLFQDQYVPLKVFRANTKSKSVFDQLFNLKQEISPSDLLQQLFTVYLNSQIGNSFCEITIARFREQFKSSTFITVSSKCVTSYIYSFCCRMSSISSGFSRNQFEYCKFKICIRT